MSDHPILDRPDPAPPELAQTRTALALAEAWREIALLPAGQIVIRDLMTISGVLATPQVLGDPHATMVNIGRQQIGLEVMARLRWSEGELDKFGRAVAHDFLGHLDGDHDQFGERA